MNLKEVMALLNSISNFFLNRALKSKVNSPYSEVFSFILHFLTFDSTIK